MGIRIIRRKTLETIRFKSGGETAEVDVLHLTGEDVREIARKASEKGRLDHALHETMILDAAVRGWRGFLEEDGSEIPFQDNAQAKERLFGALPPIFRNTVEGRALGSVEMEYAALGN